MQTSTLKTLVLVLAVLASSSVFAATVWKWVDKNGVTHYSDQPVPGAVQVNLQSVQTYNAEQATIPEGNRPARSSSAEQASTYVAIEIASPANDHTFTGTGGQVLVSIRVDPGLRAGDSIRLTVDGQDVSGPNSTATTVELKDVPRGAHTLSASVVSRDGKTLIQSSSVTFFMQQQSTLRKR
jgi:hypothetical protein